VRRVLLDYLLSRILRIYPALVICVFGSVFILGPALTSLTLSEYFDSPKTYSYLYNALALENMQWVLPGVYEENKTAAVNGSLWSLTAETRCYVILAILGTFGAFQSRVFTNVIIAVIVVFGYFYYTEIPLVGERTRWTGALTFFVAGVFFYNNRESVPLNFKTAIMSACVVYFSFGNPWFDFVFPIAFTYLLFYLSYMTPFTAVDEKLGDISYGVYIYAYPTQQMVAVFWPEAGVAGNVIISSVITISLAYASWRFIEKPALSLKNKILSGGAFISYK
jgi:peptidoglycan/LPS O-acetylase OafA/YrhL